MGQGPRPTGFTGMGGIQGQGQPQTQLQQDQAAWKTDPMRFISEPYWMNPNHPKMQGQPQQPATGGPPMQSLNSGAQPQGQGYQGGYPTGNDVITRSTSLGYGSPITPQQRQQQSNIGGGAQTQTLNPVSPTNYNTYGNNMPVGFRYGGGIRSLKYNG